MPFDSPEKIIGTEVVAEAIRRGFILIFNDRVTYCIPLSPRGQPLRGAFRVAQHPGYSAPHVLCHTFAVTAVQKGISLPALERLLGHDRLTTTEIYLNLRREAVLWGK
jgi:site-specific recombinase XerD